MFALQKLYLTANIAYLDLQYLGEKVKPNETQ